LIEAEIVHGCILPTLCFPKWNRLMDPRRGSRAARCSPRVIEKAHER
jgi:hypothetical protein